MIGLLLVLLGGCSAEPARPAPANLQGVSSYKAVTSDGAVRYKLEPNESAVVPTILAGNPTPEYPAELLVRNVPPVTMIATLVVNARGEVNDVLFASDTDSGLAPFRKAVVEATTRWRFTPLRIVHWMTMPDGSSKRVEDQPVPFSQSYAFRFEVRDGEGVVQSVPTP